MVLPVPLFQLRCGVNNYEWGKIGSSSRAANFASATTDLAIDESKPYAELWMGTHPSLPSIDVETGRSLQDLVSTNESLLGPEVVERFGAGKLPFLFKVLSINKALSIQAHPDKSLAEILHSNDPKNYPDDNHKPEMALAVTPFTGFCGFRPLLEIRAFLHNVPALASLLGEDVIARFEALSSSDSEDDRKQALVELYGKLMTSDSASIAFHAEALVASAREEGEAFAGGKKLPDGRGYADLIIQLDSQFPQDIGLFSTFFLNFVYLNPGEGMFLQANEPHAYLSGDIIECMAASDNVVRAGFTPKFKDVNTLLSMLTYRSAPVAAQKMNPIPYPFETMTSDTIATSLLYDPPIEEFSVIRIALQRGTVRFSGISGPSIVIFTGGSGAVEASPGGRKTVAISPGAIIFIGAGLSIEIRGESVECYRAFCSVDN
ncbi:hypothetical protein ABW19_dt0202572 [Dactylella cylindrospora]|nr:hypothetical protein ABW19_dt0202572 [Dactylella cylindrospora]